MPDLEERIRAVETAVASATARDEGDRGRLERIEAEQLRIGETVMEIRQIVAADRVRWGVALAGVSAGGAVVGALLTRLLAAVIAFIFVAGCAAPEAIRRETALTFDTLGLVDQYGVPSADPAIKRAVAGAAEVARWAGPPETPLSAPVLGQPPSTAAAANLPRAHDAAIAAETVREGASVAADALGTAGAAGITFGGSLLAWGLWRLVRWSLRSATTARCLVRAVEDSGVINLRATALKVADRRGVANVLRNLVLKET
ncbi:MAG: hypothetical protein HY719_13715 [Planctomycetes bacterium]|nr:hypothetical protein [Planctomycetota bacterium]